MDKEVEKFYEDLNLDINKVLKSKMRQRHPELRDEMIIEAMCRVYEEIHDHGLNISVPGMMRKVWGYASKTKAQDYVSKWRSKVLVLEQYWYWSTNYTKQLSRVG
jgi:hypothetical protein